jgi:hypothetical protein
MKRQSLVLLAVAFVAAGAAGCFKDPVDGLRNGPSLLSLNATSVYLKTGDSVAVIGYLKDDAGNVLPATGPTWTVADPTVAVVNVPADSLQPIPANAYTRAFIRAVKVTGGITTVTVVSRGITATVRVVVVPIVLPAAQYSQTGTPTTDTLVIPGQTGPPLVAPVTVIYSAPDTLVVNGTAFLTFDTASIAASVTGPTGTSTGYVIAKSPSQIKVVFTKGASGRVLLRHFKMVTGDAAAGTPSTDSVFLADSLLFAKVRYRGAITQTGDTVNFALANGISFGAATVVLFGATPGLLFDTTAGKVLATAGYTGLVTLNNARLGVATLNVLTSTASPTVTAAGFAFPGAAAAAGDTMTVTAAGRVRFDAVTRATIGGVKDSVIGWDTTHLFLLAPAGSTGILSVSNTKVGIQRLTLTAAGPFTTTTATVPAGFVTQVGDTLTVTGNAVVAVDSSATLGFGAATPTLLKRGANSISVINGAASYTGVVSLLNAKYGIVRIGSLKTAGPYTVNQASFTGAITQLGDTMTVTVPAGVSFDTAKTTIAFGANAAIALSKSATVYKVLSPATFTGPVTVKKANIGTVQVPAMVTPAPYTINGATFPSANVSVGGGVLGDTITVTAPAGITFDTAAAKLSMVLAGNMAVNTSDTAWTLSRTPTTIKAFAKRGGVGAVQITNLLLTGGTLLPYLGTPTTFAIDSINSVFPTAFTEGTAHALTIPAPANTVTVYGSANAATGPDFWTFTTTASHLLSGSLAWFGTGNPYNPDFSINPAQAALTADFDLVICNAGLACDESVPDLLGYKAASTGQPESGTTSAAKPAAQYWVGVLPFTGPYTVVYKMTVSLQ